MLQQNDHSSIGIRYFEPPQDMYYFISEFEQNRPLKMTGWPSNVRTYPLAPSL